MSGRTAVLEFLKLLADSIKFGVDEMVVKVVEYMLYKKKGIWWEDLLVREPWRFCPTLEEVAGQSNTLLFIYIMAKKAGELGVSVDPRELYRYLSNEAEWKRFEDMLLTHRGGSAPGERSVATFQIPHDSDSDPLEIFASPLSEGRMDEARAQSLVERLLPQWLTGVGGFTHRGRGSLLWRVWRSRNIFYI